MTGTTFEDRARRICSRCEVRRPCTREAIEEENPQKVLMRNVAGGGGPEHVSERVLPVRIYGGSSAWQRWASDVIHIDDCTDPKCAGCRPLDDRLDILRRTVRCRLAPLAHDSESVC